MNEFEDIDRELADAFAQRPSTLSRPSLRDVRQRARRHQRQRKASVVGACAIVGIGGAAVLATRSPANQTAVGDGDATGSTICFPTVSTIVYQDSIPTSTYWDTTSTAYSGDVFYYTVQPGDNPTAVADSFGITLSEMDAANINTPGYGLFQVGLQLAIPLPGHGTEPTVPPFISGTYTIAAGDFPGSVAEKFNVTVTELDYVNRDVPGYGGFIVGTVINIPFPSQVSPTTTNVVSTDVPQTTLFPEPTAWTTTTSPETTLPVANSVVYTDCFPVAVTTFPEATVSTIVSDTSSTTTSTIPNFTKIGTLIQVVNCSNQEGVAAFLSNALGAEGFTMVEPDTGTIDLPVTKVIYNPDDPIALQVALTLATYLGNATVEPSGPIVPSLIGTWIPGSGVIVLLGDDFAGMTLAQIAYPSVDTSSTLAPTTTTF